MSDDADVADAEIAWVAERGVAAVRRRLVGVSRSECVDCGEQIPEPRRALGGVLRCVDCQEEHEARLRQGLRGRA